MIGEVIRTDVKDVKPKPMENYRNMKPEKEMSVKEMNEAVRDKFNKAAEAGKNEDGGNIKLKDIDDNGNKFREGDNLLPNTEFEVNGYKYKTDDQGRVVSAEGKLQVKDHEERGTIKESRSAVGKGEMRDTDDRGHLIADRFNGSGGLENLVPMDYDLNRRGDYWKMENTLAEAVQDGAKVEFKVEPIYEKNSYRPTEFRVTYSIDGEKDMMVFKNEREATS